MGKTLVITNGVQKAMWANSIVKYPFSILTNENNNINAIPVTISGFIIGRLFTCKTIFLKIGFDFEIPIAVIVPNIVDITVDKIAILTDTTIASIIC